MKQLALPPLRTRALHLFALSAFGIAQPAFSYLSHQQNYFAIEGFHAVDVVLYAVAVLIVPPALAIGVELGAGLVSSRAVTFLHGVFVGAGVALLLLNALDRVLVDNLAFVVSVASGFMAARLYGSWQPVRLFLTISALAPLLFVGTFLLDEPLGKLSANDVQAEALPEVHSQTPVVLVIFDEFAVSSLMTPEGTIDAARYPNFAALARSSTWFRNATTVHDLTDWAVPAILTGQLPQRKQMPVLADHPHNLFTLLGRSYKIDAFQAITRLCPANLCANANRPIGARMSRLAAHLEHFFFTTKPLTDIPSWNNAPGDVARFIGALRESRTPHLYVLHVLLPHQPWVYLPSGRAYQSWSAHIPDRWADVHAADDAYERHLLQVGYVDRVLGRVVRQLRSVGLWNQSLFVVTADHGVSFRPGDHQRIVDPTNIGDIAPVPLFVKEPDQNRGAIDDLSARTIDIVPTIGDVLGIRIPWKVDGSSLFAHGRQPPSRVHVMSFVGGFVDESWSQVNAKRDATIARKARLFGTGDESMFAATRDQRLIGLDVSQHLAQTLRGLQANLREPSSTYFDPASSQAPSRIAGTITGTRPGKALKLAIAVNGRIAGVTTTYARDGEIRFTTLVSDAAFRAGTNTVSILAIRSGPKSSLSLARIVSPRRDRDPSAAGAK